MTLFEYFVREFSALVALTPEATNAREEEILAVLEDDEDLGTDQLNELSEIEDRHEKLLDLANIQALKTDANQTAVALSEHLKRLNDFNLLSGEVAARAVSAICLANNFSEDDWDADWDENSTALTGINIDTALLDPPLEPAEGSDRVRCFFIDAAQSGTAPSVALLDYREFLSVASIGDGLPYPDWAERVLAFLSVDTATECLREVVTYLLERADRMLDQCTVLSVSDDEKVAAAYLKYQLVLNNKLLVAPVMISSSSSLTDISSSVACEAGLLQFLEPFSMLGEVNSRKHVMDAFLSTYHVLENYMIRKVVAEIFNTNGSQLARIRDFKRIGTAIDKSEKKFLVDLFERCAPQQIAGVVFSDYCQQIANSFHLSHLRGDTPACDEFDRWCGRLDVKVRSGRLEGSIETAVFPQLIYAIRNSLVHNKETELHISNRELANEMCHGLLVELCLPVMRRLAFGLPSVLPPNMDNPIAYSTPSISLHA